MGAGKTLIKAAKEGASTVLSKKELKAQLKAAKRTARENKKNTAPAASRPPVQPQPKSPTPKEAAQTEYRAKRDKKHAEKAEVRQRSKADAEQKRRNKQTPSQPKAPASRTYSFPTESTPVQSTVKTPKTVQSVFKKAQGDYYGQKMREDIESKMRVAQAIRENAAAATTKQEAALSEKQSSGWFGKVRNYFDQKKEAKLNDFQKNTKAFIKQSGGTFDETAAGIAQDDHWYTSNAKKEMINRLNSSRSNLYEKMQGAKNADEMQKLMEESGIKYKKGMSNEELNQNINAKYQEMLGQGPNMGDYFHGNHGMGVTAFGVSGATALAMANSRGRKSNNELYSNPF